MPRKEETHVYNDTDKPELTLAGIVVTLAFLGVLFLPFAALLGLAWRIFKYAGGVN